jgi:hypothetical protein
VIENVRQIFSGKCPKEGCGCDIIVVYSKALGIIRRSLRAAPFCLREREIGSEPNALLLRRKEHGAWRGSPGSFAAQKRLAQDDNQRGFARASE